MKWFPRTDALLRAATSTACTGAVARIESGGVLLFERAYGSTRQDALGTAVYVDTPFDLASLGKLFVATMALALVTEDRLRLDEPLLPWFPEWTALPHAAITLRMLLAHTSGMNSGADFRTLLGRNVEAYAIRRELAASPGTRVIYSDLGFIAVGSLIERVASRALPEVLRERFRRPSLCYRPPERRRRAIPATEDDGWRGRVQGVVHDEKAYLMNGVAGHAGIFGTAADVASLGETYLGAVTRNVRGPIVDTSLAREAVREAAFDPVLRRGLGWALKTNDSNSCGRHFSNESFGHTGFVGTCVWADPRRDLQAVLLTNTVYFGRSDSRPLRAAFFETLLEEYDG